MSDNVKETEAGMDKAAETAAEGGKKKVSETLDKAREKLTGVAGEVEKRVKTAGDKASQATRQVKKSAETASTAAKEKYGVAKEKVRVGYDRARKDLDTLVEDVNEYTRDNPGKAVLIAAAAGFVLGLLMRPRRD